MIQSMTAYATSIKAKEPHTVEVEIKSYNSRHLDTFLKIPHSYQSLEEPVRSAVTQKIARGRVELRMMIKDESDEGTAYEVDQAKARSYHRALSDLLEIFNINREVTLSDLISINGLIKPAENRADPEVVWPLAQEAINEALTHLISMRKTEGDFIAGDLEKRLLLIEEALRSIQEESKDIPAIYKERLQERITSITKGVVELDTARIAQEAAFLADKSDISEEIVRADSHVAQFRAIMESPEPGGRKLNFLLQELNREFNTMGSKCGNARAAHLIVTVKSELEKIREQVQNIE